MALVAAVAQVQSLELELLHATGLAKKSERERERERQALGETSDEQMLLSAGWLLLFRR